MQAVWVGIVGSALILAIAFVSASNLTRPIRALERAMVRVGKGDRSISLFDTSGDEIGRLTAEFNTMTTSLSHQEQELQIRGAAMDAAHEMIVITDSSGIIEYINNAFTEETGYSSEEMIGNTMRVLKSEHQSHDFYLDLWGTVLGGRVWTGTLVNKRKDGTEYPEEMVATPITDDEGNVVRIIAIKREISRFLESKNNELERLNEARSEFLSSVSHELRTPLTSILAFSDIIRRNRDDNLKPLQIEQLELISKGGRRLDEMIEELLDVSRSVSGKFTLNRIPFDVQESIEELSSTVMGIFDERRQKLEIVNLLNPTLMNGDRGRIMQVFSNLLTNASKYSPPGSSVEFVARAENDVLEMTIVDQGMGISAEDQQKLFIPFFRAENGQMDGVRGMGLGLVVVKTIVELHGGRIEIESEVGMGTTVRAWIPGILPEAPELVGNRLRNVAHTPLTCRMAAEPSFRTSSGGVRSSPVGVLNEVPFWRSMRDAQSHMVVSS